MWHHIVPLLDFTMDPVPTIVMELYTLGHLKNQTLFFSRNESIQRPTETSPHPISSFAAGPKLTITSTCSCQTLTSPIEGSDLVTFCGTLEYQAPEVCGILYQVKPKRRVSSSHNDEDKYTCAVDLWSLGVVVLQIAFGLPDDTKPTNPSAWTHRLILKVTSLGNILSHMIVIDPEARITSSDCHALARNLALFGEEPSHVFPVPSAAAFTSNHSFGSPGEGGLQPEPSYEPSPDRAQSALPFSAILPGAAVQRWIPAVPGPAK
ncbi:hypothetical protein PspLS_08579 [Pyricularia sp. CBS 133598]|nr:hypothetical protein PspLS_08579 [Pyricularia sp. CBS 133598]